MKKLYTFLAAILLTATTFAQTPEKMSYQAVVRDSGDALVTNQAVGMQISILQTTATGTAVYVETQTPTTNVNGLVTLEIGTGTVVSGDFTTIDWSTDSYFIKTETDPTGGSSYTITGTSQLLSVPYALHAKTAENGVPTGGIEGQVLTILGGVPTWRSCTDTWFADTDGDGYGDVNVSSVACTAPIGYVAYNSDCNDNDATTNPGAIDIAGDGIDNNCDGLIDEVAIGHFAYGGVVFWLDPSDNTHGLVCAIQDQSTAIQWYNGSNISVGATGAVIGTGTTNTDAIITAQGAVQTNYAAGLAKAYGGGGFNDWFFPSKDELNEIYLNKVDIEATATANGGTIFNSLYWSSTEAGVTVAWNHDFSNGNQNASSKNVTISVRAVRAF